MSQNDYDPIYIRPLTLRGVFGITHRLVHRNFWGLMGFALVYVLAVFAAMLLCMLPIILPLLGRQTESGGMFALATASGVILTLLLLGILALVNWLVVAPMFAGTLYGELSARIYAYGAGCGRLLARGKFSLKRFFTLNLCHSLCVWAVSVAVSILTSAVTAVVSVSVAVSQLTSDTWAVSPGVVVLCVILSLLVSGISLCGTAFLAFVYPVAVNEGAKNFSAIGRSLKLVGKRFGRVLGCSAILWAAGTAAQLVLMGVFVLLVFALGLSANIPALVIAFLLFFLMEVFVSSLITLYTASLHTVLYCDTRVRLEGDKWLDYGERFTYSYQPPCDGAFDPNTATPPQQPAPDDLGEQPLQNEPDPAPDVPHFEPQWPQPQWPEEQDPQQDHNDQT